METELSSCSRDLPAETSSVCTQRVPWEMKTAGRGGSTCGRGARAVGVPQRVQQALLRLSALSGTLFLAVPFGSCLTLGKMHILSGLRKDKDKETFSSTLRAACHSMSNALP